MATFLKLKSIVNHVFLVNVEDIAHVHQKPDHAVHGENNEVIVTLKNGESHHVIGRLEELIHRLKAVEGVSILTISGDGQDD